MGVEGDAMASGGPNDCVGVENTMSATNDDSNYEYVDDEAKPGGSADDYVCAEGKAKADYEYGNCADVGCRKKKGGCVGDWTGVGGVATAAGSTSGRASDESSRGPTSRGVTTDRTWKQGLHPKRLGRSQRPRLEPSDANKWRCNKTYTQACGAVHSVC